MTSFATRRCLISRKHPIAFGSIACPTIRSTESPPDAASPKYSPRASAAQTTTSPIPITRGLVILPPHLLSSLPHICVSRACCAPRSISGSEWSEGCTVAMMMLSGVEGPSRPVPSRCTHEQARRTDKPVLGRAVCVLVVVVDGVFPRRGGRR